MSDYNINNTPKLIAGPCSAESRSQVFAIAQELKKLYSITYFRAGIWKPRTSPNSFQGIGEEGLLWLNQVQEELNISIITEVANTNHVEACLKHNITNFWIGARTTINPIYVQEIANSLKGVKANVLIKNPISPDLKLWIGAIERFKKINIESVGAIHRGFFSYKKSKYRNDPMWEIPIALKTKFPDIDLYCDPSHISGDASFLKEVSQKAVDLGIQNFMFEVHNNPNNALSDSSQQITPKELLNLLNSLNTKRHSSSSKKIEALREKINDLDLELFNILANRMDIVKKLAALKQEENITYFQLKRWLSLLVRNKEYGESLGLSEELVENIMRAIHKESIITHYKSSKKKND